MPTLRHPIRNESYELLENGTIRVVNHDLGLEGIFAGNGTWLSGDLRFAEKHMVEWVGGAHTARRIAASRAADDGT